MASNQQAQPRAKKKRRNYSKDEDKKLLLVDQSLTYFFLRENEIAEGKINETDLVIETEKAYGVPRSVTN